MNRTSIALLLLATAGIAQAGSTGAGPAASAAPAVGSTITPGSNELLNTESRGDRFDRLLPGNGGMVVLSGEQVARVAEALKAFEGARVENHVIHAPTVLADGTPASIALNTKTGQLKVTRLER